ncbi:hypothetical protein MHH28_07620 [Paenibacillus sp. FSL K6-1217]|uniref:hypothetical protein n=1 Tax=Paenibacillus sp. FSL K6-1217 TaxID=2921466 RepID=UPI0032454A8C
MDNQTGRKIGRRSVPTAKRIPWCWTFKEIASEEFNYIIDIITGGKRPGKAVPDEDSHN